MTENKLTLVLVEPEIKSYNIDPDLIESKINSRTKGIMIVHHYGKNAMNTRIANLVNTYKLKLIEDNALAQGAFFSYKRTG
jgi:dTDP-4-amino-4,6-dideoxygalactose transaminase